MPADLLATAEELALLMRDTGLDEESATFLLELVTGEVQAVTGQTLLLVEDDEIEIQGNTDSWLYLPERPVSEVASITIDGGDELVAGTDYKRTKDSASLWRHCGWSTCIYEPATVAITYTHGREVGHRRLQFARSSVLGVSKAAYSNVSGVTSESIDDYRVTFPDAVAAVMAENENLSKALRRYYGTRAGLVRLG